MNAVAVKKGQSMCCIDRKKQNNVSHTVQANALVSRHVACTAYIGIPEMPTRPRSLEQKEVLHRVLYGSEIRFRNETERFVRAMPGVKYLLYLHRTYVT